MQDGAEVVEVVGRFETRSSFLSAVRALRRAGFEHSDISVLDTHESIEAAGKEGAAWRETLSGLVGEITYIGPLASAGLIAVAAGPVGALVASGIAAGISGLALRDALEKAQATPHTEDFARALERGAVLLWVRADWLERQQEALAILEGNGAKDVHLHRRAAGER